MTKLNNEVKERINKSFEFISGNNLNETYPELSYSTILEYTR